MLKFRSKNNVSVDYKCTIRLLDDNEVLQCEIQKDQKGHHLQDYACSQLNLIEKEYFGLRYVDSSKQRHWLDPARSVLKQVKGMEPIIFCFRVKFYPPDPHRLREEITRYQIFLQLRRDLLHGRLYCSQSDAALLAAYIIQSELGDYDPDEHVGNYISEFKLLLKQTTRTEEKIAEIHQTQLRGQVPASAEMNFLRKACLLDTYGVDPHPVKDQKGTQLYLGVNHVGILTFQGSRKTHHFKWQDVQKLNYEGKMFIIHLIFNEKKHTIGFKCPSTAACKHLWRCAVEQRLFFTGRAEKEGVEESNAIVRDPPEFCRIRTLSFRQRFNTLPNSLSCSQDGDTSFVTIPRPKQSTPLPESEILHEEDPRCHDNDCGLDRMTDRMDRTPATYMSYNADSMMMNDSGLDSNVTPYAIRSFSSSVDVPYPDSPVASNDGFNFSEANRYHEDYSGRVNTTDVTHSAEVQTDVSGVATLAPQANSVEEFQCSAPPSPTVKADGFSRLFLPALFFAMLFLLFSVLLLLESNAELLSDLRRTPELVIIRREYYEPLKEYLRKVIDSIMQVFR